MAQRPRRHFTRYYGGNPSITDNLFALLIWSTQLEFDGTTKHGNGSIIKGLKPPIVQQFPKAS